MKNKNVLFVLMVLGIIAFVSCEKTTTPEKPKPVQRIFKLSLNGAGQQVAFEDAKISYLLNSDTTFIGSYKITLSVNAKVGGIYNLNFSAWCYDVHNPGIGSIKAKKYYIEPSRCDCRAYRDTTLCDGSSLTFNIGETIYNSDATDVSSYINISSCDVSTKTIGGDILVKTIATTNANDIQVVAITFSNITYSVIN